jgi:hypothetical protein
VVFGGKLGILAQAISIGVALEIYLKKVLSVFAIMIGVKEASFR